MDAGSSPGRVLARHGVEGSPNLGPGDRSANRFASGAKAPVQTEAFPVPSNDCVRLHDQKRIRPLRPHSAQQNPEQSVGTAQVRPFSPPFQDYQLLPQGDDFKSQVMTRPNKASQPYEHTTDQPRWTSQNRPYVDTSKPANGAEPEQEYLYPGDGRWSNHFFVGESGGFILTSPGWRVRQRRDATGAPTQQPE